jgi:16S rRNA (uracil1498-N3)-methyltransferase
MPHNRYYCDAPLVKETRLHLEDEEGHHLIRVLRARLGNQVELINGRGQLAQATIVEITKHSAELLIDSVEEQGQTKPSVILAMAIPRMAHLEWVIEKGTELDATAFWLFPGLLSEKPTLSASQQERLRHLAISAMKQCGRLDLPPIEYKPPLLKWTPLSGTLLFGDTDDQAPYLWNIPLTKPLSLPVIWFIGPERGFEIKEHQFLRKTLQAHGVRLHPNILRTETAPLVALSLTQALIN